MDITRAIICISLFHVQQQQQSQVFFFSLSLSLWSLLVPLLSSRYDFTALELFSWHSIYNQLKHKPTIYHSDILEASLIKSRESIIKGRWIRLPTNYVGQFCLLKTNCQMVSPTICDNDVSFSISCHNNWQF